MSQEEGGLMHPTGSNAARAERAEQQSAQQAQVRTLVDHHAALAREFLALHEQARAVYIQDEPRRAAPPR
jgi:hypothetical protein